MTSLEIIKILSNKFADPNDRKYWENKLKEVQAKERAAENNAKKVWRGR